MIAAAGALIGLSPRISKIVAGILAILAMILVFYWALDAYGDREYAKGKQDEKAAWEAAEDKFLTDAALAKTEADRTAALREADHAQQVAQEREEINEAVADGRSPFDVLFPSSVQ